jgi:hypothetical protein
MIHIMGFCPWRCATLRTQRAVHIDQIKKRTPGTELIKADVRDFALNLAIEDVEIKRHHGFDVTRPDHNVINTQKGEWSCAHLPSSPRLRQDLQRYQQ